MSRGVFAGERHKAEIGFQYIRSSRGGPLRGISTLARDALMLTPTMVQTLTGKGHMKDLSSEAFSEKVDGMGAKKKKKKNKKNEKGKGDTESGQDKESGGDKDG